MIKTFTEVESGKINERPELEKALHLAKVAALRRARKGNTASLRVIKEEASQHAENLRPVVEALHSEGVTSLGRIAEALNDRGMLTPRCGRWHKSSVRNLIARLEAQPVT